MSSTTSPCVQCPVLLERYKQSLEDIARTKDRQFQFAYYSLLLLVGVFVLGEKSVASFDRAMSASVVVAALALVLAYAVWFHGSLHASLKRFRELRERFASELGMNDVESTWTKNERDKWLPLGMLTALFGGSIWIWTILIAAN